MLKIAVLSVEAKRHRASGRLFFQYRLDSSSDECQHADIAESCFDGRREKYSVLYFFMADDDDEKKQRRRGSVLASMQGVVDG